MASLDQAPENIRRWFEAEKSAEPAQALRPTLSPDVVMDFGGRKIRGVDAVVGTVIFIMPPGWLGDVEWTLLPQGADGRLTVRATGRGGTPVKIFIPGAPSQSINAMDLIFTLDGRGLIVGLAGQAHPFAEPGDVSQPLRPGNTAPPFVLPDVEGVKVAVHKQGATAAVVAFVSNHCPFSLAWHDRLQRVARDYASRGVHFLNIISNDPAQGPNDSVEYSRKRIAKGQFGGPLLIDERQIVARRWGVRHTPEVFVLDEHGVVAYHGAPDADSGDESLNAAWLRGAIDHVLAGTPPDPPETQPVGCSIKWTR